MSHLGDLARQKSGDRVRFKLENERIMLPGMHEKILLSGSKYSLKKETGDDGGVKMLWADNISSYIPHGCVSVVHELFVHGRNRFWDGGCRAYLRC